MKKYIIALIITILFLSSPAYALYRVTDFVGGCADCADAIDGARFNAKTKPVYVIVTTTPEHATYPSKEFAYLWDSDAGCSEVVPNSIIPDTNASGGCLMLLTPGQAADIVADSVKDTHIDWGTGADQVSAVDVPIADGGSLITGTEVETALQENRGLIDTNITAIGLNTTAVATSAGLAGSLSDETGSGAAVFGTGATIGTPAISGGTVDSIVGSVTPLAGSFTDLTGTAAFSWGATNPVTIGSDGVMTGSDAATGGLFLEGDGDDGGETLHIQTEFDATSGQSGIAKNARFRANFTGYGILPKFTSLGNTLWFAPADGQTYTSTEAVYGVTSRFTVAGPTTTGTVILPEYAGFISGGTIASSHTMNITDIYHYKAEDFGAVNGTQTNVYGFWLDNMTTGTNNYGIVLDGDNEGSDICFGADQDACLMWSTTPGLDKMYLNGQFIVGLGADVANMNGDFNIVGVATTNMKLRDSTNDEIAIFQVENGAVTIGSETATGVYIKYSASVHTSFTADGHTGTMLGTDPAITTCGTSPSTAAGSTDNAGIVNVGGGGAVTACTVTFNTAYATEPMCQITTQHNSTAYLSASATTAFTVTFSADAQSQQFAYHCMGLGE